MSSAPQTRVFVGIDPGASGGLVAIHENGDILNIAKTGGLTASERRLAITDAIFGHNYTVFLEAVHAMPKQGVSSTFKFGFDFGLWQGLLQPWGYELVSPQKWQRAMGCLTGGDKGVSRAAAHRLWPGEAKLLTNATADAALIAEYGRRKTLGGGTRRGTLRPDHRRVDGGQER